MARFAAVFLASHASKRLLGETGINTRPSGGTHGLPSAHTAAATFGASALVHECLPKVPVVQAAVILAPYAGIGAGVAVPHVDVTPAGGPQTFGLQLAGPALQAVVGQRRDLSPRWSVFGEVKATCSRHDAELEGGGRRKSDLTTGAFNLGLNRHF